VRPEWKAIMNTVEDLLREGMERFTRDLRAPAGLIRSVARRRRRRLALRSAAGVAATLTAGAVALAAVEIPSALHSGADATAYVVKRVNSALNAAPGEIAQITVTTSGVGVYGGTTATTTAEEWSYGHQWRSIKNSPAGQPVYDEGSSTASVYILVNYKTRTWARQPESGPAPVVGRRDCELGVAALQLLFQPELPGSGVLAVSPSATVPGALRAAISCGALAVAGRQRVGGIDAIELTTSRESPASETIWVSPGTYLPLRVVVRSYGPDHGLFVNGQLVLMARADITWLAPTAHNLAKLAVPIPGGFRHVPLAEAAAPLAQQSPRGWSRSPKLFCLGPGGPACNGRTSPSLPSQGPAPVRNTR
jgi:hypothetical protein